LLASKTLKICRLTFISTFCGQAPILSDEIPQKICGTHQDKHQFQVMSSHALAHSPDSFLTLESSRHSSKSFSPHALKTTHVHKEKRERIQDYSYPSSKTEKEPIKKEKNLYPKSKTG
jgi:hypothetical protein